MSDKDKRTVDTEEKEGRTALAADTADQQTKAGTAVEAETVSSVPARQGSTPAVELSPPQSVPGTVIATDAAVTRRTSPRTAGRTALGADAISHPITSRGTVIATEAARP